MDQAARSRPRCLRPASSSSLAPSGCSADTVSAVPSGRAQGGPAAVPSSGAQWRCPVTVPSSGTQGSGQRWCPAAERVEE